MAPIEIQNITPLFDDVQLNRLFPDGKTFVDCLPRLSPEEISAKYNQQKDRPGFSLQQFVTANFELPFSHSSNYQSDTDKTVAENINRLWEVLTRQPDKVGGSLIPLPHSVSRSRWKIWRDLLLGSRFTMLGLTFSGKYE